MNIRLFSVLLFLSLASLSLISYIVTKDIINAVLALMFYFAPLYVQSLYMIVKLENEHKNLGENVEK